MRTETGTERRNRGLALAFGAAVVSGVAVFVNAYGVKRFSDATAYTTLKNAVAALILGAALLAARGRRRTPPAAGRTRASWLGLAALGIVGGSVPFVLFFEGLARASAPQAAFLHKTLVVWVAILAVPLLRERAGAWHLGAIALLVGGQAALAGGLGGLRAGGGEAMILAATILWAVEFVIAKRVLASFGALTVGTARMGLGLVALAGYCAFTGRLGALAVTGEQLGWVLLTGGILGAYVGFWYAALARVQAVDAAAVLVFAVVVTAALQAAVDGTIPGAAGLLGLGLVAAGAAVAVRAARRRAPEAVPA